MCLRTMRMDVYVWGHMRITEWIVVRSGPGEARTILPFQIISAGPSKQPIMVRTFLKVYMELGSYFVTAKTKKRHHHQGCLRTRLCVPRAHLMFAAGANDLSRSCWADFCG